MCSVAWWHARLHNRSTPQLNRRTRAGVECVAHVVQTLTDLQATVLSVDGVGAFHLISRAAMLEGLLGIEGGDAVLPFVSQFYSWVSREIIQGEGGEQGASTEPWSPSARDCSLMNTSRVSSGARGPHSHPDEGTVMASRPDSDPPRQNSGLELGSDGARQR